MERAGLLLIMIPVVVIAAGAAASAASLPGCRSTCGDVDIPYPFGIGDGCSLDGFSLTCNETLMKPFLGNIEIINISVPQGQIRVLNHISWQCYNHTNDSIDYSTWSLNMENPPFRFSDALNKFTVIGCDTLAYIDNFNKYQSGCVSMCENKQSLVNGSCSGIGCCQTSIPKNLNHYNVWFDSNFNNSRIWNFSRCSYAVMLEADLFTFQNSNISPTQLWDNGKGSRMPVVVDWAIGNNQTCELAKRNQTSYACRSQNSVCVNSSNGPGYLCNCSSGYQGNPYLKDGGCQDINECHPNNPCTTGAICSNLQGNYTCSCPRGTHGEPYRGTCTPDQKLSMAVKVVIGTSSGLAFIFFCSIFICMAIQRRKLTEVRERYFKEHGGRLLLEEIKKKQGLAFKIFKREELERVTDKFDENRVIGRGGHGTVYKGVLEDRTVAIKKSKIIDEGLKNEFGKEMLILSQINHKNIVKLLGCCLEVEVPILVYEFIPNGTLFHLIHSNHTSLSLAIRLKIAYESADALAYLHSSASPPIIHGDVKTCNILLDENYNAKISDFGASKFIPKDEDQFATLVQGTCGYLDPEYLLTCQLTDKSDVYSFGVVLLEMVTGRKAIYFEGSEEGRSLVSSFFLAMDQNRFSDILDNRVKDEGDLELFQELSELIKRCLKLKGDKRPTMKEVADELDKLRKFQQHPWVPQNSEEITSLLREPSDYGMDTTANCNTLEIGYALNIESGR